MDERYTRARAIAGAVKAQMWDYLKRDTNIVGVAFGRRIVSGQPVDEPALVIYVGHKVPARFLPPSRHLPRRAYIGTEPIEVDVLETGPFFPLSFTTRDRPAPSGISIGRALDQPVDAGTLGALVRDNTDQTICILSCNHVLANENAGSIGDAIVQPGTIDGGTSPADDIATLKRFITINAAGNTVDCAIAQVIAQELGATVVNEMKNNLMPVPSPQHPAVGLLFAGACTRTTLNPIDMVLKQLNCQFLSGGNSTTTADIGMNVEKVGRTTEYTTATIAELDVSITVNYTFGPGAFDHQIAVHYLADPGDSGSVVCKGGKGSTSDCPSCGSSSGISEMLETDVSMESAIASEFRDKHLRQTRVGNYVVDVFAENEDQIAARIKQTSLAVEDRIFLQSIYEKHALEIQLALLQPDRTTFRFSDDHIADLQQVVSLLWRYLFDDERRAAESLLEVAATARGKTIRESLESLNEDSLLDRVVDVLSHVKFLKKPQWLRR